ncbi:MAG TPA: cobalamin-dependent protein, partial [Treponemataceae bacterium]|nr:cobalamin-dependent protein [Treponemataceae bacterium]
MKKPLFVAVNSRYNHTNLAIRSIASYCAVHSKRQLSILEASIAEFPTNILRSIYERLKEESDRDGQIKQELIIFSVYIWNAPLIYEVANELKKILPRALIGFGGPEVSYQAEKVFFENSSLDFIVKGEGEETVKELV